MNNSKTVNVTIFEGAKATNAQSLILHLLTEHPHLRDNDQKLLANVWHWQTNPHGISGYDLLKMLADGQLTNPETVRRLRQKLQEKNPNLRGESYTKRQKDGAKIRKTIKNI